MSLHARLLRATSPLTVAEERSPEELAAALRAVVELHAPVPCNYGNCLNAAHRVCKKCGPGVTADDCETVQAIARELGIEAS